jgi:hypothetical protein
MKKIVKSIENRRGRIMSNKISEYLDYVKKVAEIINEKGIAARVIKIDKAGSEEYGLRITEDPNSIYKATIKLNTPDEFFEKHDDEETYADEIIKQVLECESPVRTGEAELLKKKYDEIKKYIYPRIMDKERHKAYLEKVPNRDYLDYAVAYCYIRDGKILTITNEIAERLNVSEQQMFQDSINNIEPRGPISILKLMAGEVLNAIGSEIRGYDGNQENPLYVISNKEMSGGINALLLPDFLKKIATDLGGDYYAMTCSADFAVVIAAKIKWLETEDMMLFAENIAKVISGIDNVLSNKLYRYSSQTGLLERIL